MREPIGWATASVVMAGAPAVLALVYWPLFGRGGWVVILLLWGGTLVAGCVMLGSRPTVRRSIGAGLVGACVAMATLPVLLGPVLSIGGAIAGGAS